MKHPEYAEYKIGVETSELKQEGFRCVIFLTLGTLLTDFEDHELKDVLRSDLADHHLYKHLQKYVLENPR